MQSVAEKKITSKAKRENDFTKLTINLEEREISWPSERGHSAGVSKGAIYKKWGKDTQKVQSEYLTKNFNGEKEQFSVRRPYSFCEKVGSDFYKKLSNNEFYVPKTRLAITSLMIKCKSTNILIEQVIITSEVNSFALEIEKHFIAHKDKSTNMWSFFYVDWANYLYQINIESNIADQIIIKLENPKTTAVEIEKIIHGCNSEQLNIKMIKTISVCSKWENNFTPFLQNRPKITSEGNAHIEYDNHEIQLSGYFRMLLIATFLDDWDVIGREGDNAGLLRTGTDAVELMKIDMGKCFCSFTKVSHKFTKSIFVLSEEDISNIKKNSSAYLEYTQAIFDITNLTDEEIEYLIKGDNKQRNFREIFIVDRNISDGTMDSINIREYQEFLIDFMKERRKQFREAFQEELNWRDNFINQGEEKNPAITKINESQEDIEITVKNRFSSIPIKTIALHPNIPIADAKSKIQKALELEIDEDKTLVLFYNDKPCSDDVTLNDLPGIKTNPILSLAIRPKNAATPPALNQACVPLGNDRHNIYNEGAQQQKRQREPLPVPPKNAENNHIQIVNNATGVWR